MKPTYVFVSAVLFFMLLHESCASNDKTFQAVENQQVICEKESVKAVDF